MNVSVQGEDTIEPWMGVWIAQMGMLGSMLRGATPKGPPEETGDADALVGLFELKGLPPAEARKVILRAVDGVRHVAGEAPRNFAVPITLWLDRHEQALKASAESLASYYEREYARVVNLPLDELTIFRGPPDSVFEGIFAKWITDERPSVLEQAFRLILGDHPKPAMKDRLKTGHQM